MNADLFDNLQKTLASAGPTAAIDQLIAELTQVKDYQGLFYSILMKRRHELGLSPVPTAPNHDLPSELVEPFEEAIRQAARTVGGMLLQDGNLPGAFAYFNMIGEIEPVRAALDEMKLTEDVDTQPLIDIAFYQGVNPKRGFDWILERHGICNSITSLGGDVPLAPDVRTYCMQRLIRALHTELLTRLKAEIAGKQGFEPSGQTIADLIRGRDWLFSDEYYHIDLSHLSSVVQMSIALAPCAELELARDLCAYGKMLSPRFAYRSDPPFDQSYQDYDMYLGILTGADIEGGVAHFRAKAEQADPYEVGTYPAEVLVNLLLRLDRPREALETARKFLGQVSDARLSCPNLVELCQRTGSYDVLAAVAREQNNPVNFLAGLLGPGKKSAV